MPASCAVTGAYQSSVTGSAAAFGAGAGAGVGPQAAISTARIAMIARMSGVDPRRFVPQAPHILNLANRNAWGAGVVDEPARTGFSP